jgi:hypothetical protein
MGHGTKTTGLWVYCPQGLCFCPLDKALSFSGVAALGGSTVLPVMGISLYPDKLSNHMKIKGVRQGQSNNLPFVLLLDDASSNWINSVYHQLN